MSIKIIKKGLSDTIQDYGRYGYQHLGIQPNGYMDFISAWLANKILEKDIHDPVFEIHFPSSQLLFENDHTICITGANFIPVINEKSIVLNKPVHVKAGEILSMLQPIHGKTCYVSVQEKLLNSQWLSSHANSKPLKIGDIFEYKNQEQNKAPKNDYSALINEVTQMVFNNHAPIRILPGPAWPLLNKAALVSILSSNFLISASANRMGFNIIGPTLSINVPNTFLSSAVCFGTLQLLPNGNIIVLMADHQTTGGYANLGQIILVDLPRFAQLHPSQPFNFELCDLDQANQLYLYLYEKFKH